MKAKNTKTVKKTKKAVTKVESTTQRAASRFFHFSQNNSGGSFDYDASAGITHHVIIEAVDYNDANARAEAIGLYFNGCSDGRDCPCCGDRWSSKGDWETEGSPFPALYGSQKEEDNITKPGFRFSFGWMDAGREACVHYLDGRKEWF